MNKWSFLTLKSVNCSSLNVYFRKQRNEKLGRITDQVSQSVSSSQFIDSLHGHGTDYLLISAKD